jgi:hypothetical protein
VAGFNRHENPEVAHQPEGTGIIEVNEISQYCKKPGNDFRGLGRWSWYSLKGPPSHRIQIISVYNVGKSRPVGPTLVYQQHLRYTQTHGMDVTPYDIFCDDLLMQL